MMYSTDVVFRDFPTSPALAEKIHKKLDKLSRYSDTITHTRVVVDSPHNHKHKGRMFRASVEFNLKGKPVMVTHDDTDAHVALRDAFKAAERKLKESAHKKREFRQPAQFTRDTID